MSKHPGCRLSAMLLAAAFASSCGGGRPGGVVSADTAGRDANGQVTPAAAGNPVSYYAAFRFAEQASFGPTPALIAEIRAKGFEKWIDAQFALPASTMDPVPAGSSETPLPPRFVAYYRNAYQGLLMTAPDQLRLRVSWSLGQFIVAVEGEPYGQIHWINMLQRQSFGRYDELLLETALHPVMGRYLDNAQNRPKSEECAQCAPNENFARELMQLFSLGLILLNADGSPVRDKRGNFVETYTQADVDELARVLTGWQYNRESAPYPWDWANFGKRMVASTWPPERDSGAKQVLGRSFPAGQSTRKDLDDAIAMLMSHQNIAPFVSLRMIQHLVKSNPSPAYLSRVAAKFRNNGSGVVGDMKAVIKAVLLDAEARIGDVPGAALSGDGKFREPVLHSSALYRGLGCAGTPNWHERGYWLDTQLHFEPLSVFSFYAPTDRAPGSNLLAPEQKIVTAGELRRRMIELNGLRWNNAAQRNDLSIFKTFGCQLDPLMKAYASSPRAFNDYLSLTFFRGAMPPTLRSNIEQMMSEPIWDPNAPDSAALLLLSYALATPYFGVMK